MSVQGSLHTSSGAPASGTFDIELRLFGQSSGGSALWTTLAEDVVVEGGVFDVVLSLDPAVLGGDPALWLEAAVDGQVMPRRPLTGVPYALVAQRANVALLASDLACSGCVQSSAAGFPYAASSSKGGDALNVACTGCITPTKIAALAIGSGHIQDGAVTQAKVGFPYAASASIAGPASNLACSGCVAGSEIAPNVALSGDVSATGSVAACTSTVDASCGLKLDGAGLYVHSDGWLTVRSTNGLRVRAADPSSAVPAPLQFGAGTALGDLTVYGNASATGSLAVGGSLDAASVAASTITANLLSAQQLQVSQGATLAASAGSVGVGTASPSAKLHVVGGVRTDEDNPVRIGNTIFNAFSTSLPTTGSSGGYSTAPLHLKTDWVCGVTHLMYNIEFKGLHFIGRSEINAVAVGYLYGSNGHTYDGTRTISGGVTVSAYCSAVDSKLVFRLVAPSDWHASDLVVHYTAGKLSYTRNGANSFTIITAKHSNSNI